MKILAVLGLRKRRLGLDSPAKISDIKALAGDAKPIGILSHHHRSAVGLAMAIGAFTSTPPCKEDPL